MENKTIPLSEATIEQLKSVGYDCLLRIQNDQRALDSINQEIAERNKLSDAPAIAVEPSVEPQDAPSDDLQVETEESTTDLK